MRADQPVQSLFVLLNLALISDPFQICFCFFLIHNGSFSPENNSCRNKTSLTIPPPFSRKQKPPKRQPPLRGSEYQLDPVHFFIVFCYFIIHDRIHMGEQAPRSAVSNTRNKMSARTVRLTGSPYFLTNFLLGRIRPVHDGSVNAAHKRHPSV